MRQKTPLAPVGFNDTRWTGKMEMVRRYFRLEEFLDKDDIEIMALIPTALNCIKLRELLEVLNKFESITKKLQDASITMDEVRILFDGIILLHPTMKSHLSPDATIVANPTLESGIVKVLNSEVSSLTAFEKNALRPFKKEEESEVVVVEVVEEKIGFAESLIRSKKRKTVTTQQEYIDLDFIPATSNLVERFFSASKLVLTDFRQSLYPINVEAVMYLKLNRHFWNVKTMERVVSKHGLDVQ